MMTSVVLLRMPELSLRWLPVWRRNLLVWRKLAIASVLGNIADPAPLHAGAGLRHRQLHP
jgi:lipooligosaccharide transport system permease protein